MAELAQGHAVADVIVLASAPWDDMGGIHYRVLFRCNDPHPAQGAAVVVGLDHDAAKALVAGRRAVVVRLDDLLDQRQVGFFLQQPAVVERLPVDNRLLPQQRSCLWRETGLQQRFPKGLSPLSTLHDPEQPLVQLCSQGMFAQVGDGGGVVDDCRCDGRARLRHQLPERFPVEAGEGKGDAAGLAEGDDPPPVEVEQLIQFHQIAADGNERRCYDATMHQVQHRHQQERLVRGLALGGLGPGRAGGAVEGGEVFDAGGEVGHDSFSQFESLWIATQHLIPMVY